MKIMQVQTEYHTTSGPNRVRGSNMTRYAAAGGLLAAADAPENQAVRQDREKSEGTWRVAALDVNGVKASEADARKLTVTNGADGAWAMRAEGKEVMKGTSTIDPMNRPKTVDFVPTDGANAGRTNLGIYEIEGDAQKVCFAPPGKDRPTEFASEPGSWHILVALERERK